MAEGMPGLSGAADISVFERAARAAFILTPPLWPLAVADTLVQAVSGDDVVLPHDPWSTHQAFAAIEQGGVQRSDTVLPQRFLHQFLGFFGWGGEVSSSQPILFGAGGRDSASGTAAAGKGGASGGVKGSGGPGVPGGPRRPGGTPPGGGDPSNEKAVVELWLKELDIDREPRVKALGFTEQRALVLIASRNRGYALGLVNNRTLENLNLPGVRGTDQLALVLTLYDRLERAGVMNNGAYFSNGLNLLSDREYELAGIIQEMAFVGAVAENAAVNGYHTQASEYSDVPARILHEELEFLPDDLPRISDATLQRIAGRAQIDGYVVGDRIVEVKLRARKKVVYSREDARDDESYVSEQYQALKLLAVAKRDGLRGVEFALFGTAVDDDWVDMVQRASTKIGVGVQIVLYPPSGDVQEVLNTMPEMERRSTPVNVEQSPIRPPKVERKYSQRELEWGGGVGIDFEAVRYMLSFVSEPKVRKQAEGNPRVFHKAIRSRHAREILDGFRRTIEGHFTVLGELTPRQEETRERWRRSWGELNGVVSHVGDTVGVENARRMAMMAQGLLHLTREDKDAHVRLVEARNRFLRNAQGTIAPLTASFQSLAESMSKLNYLAAPSFLAHIDTLREVALMEKLRGLAAAEGITELADLSLADVPALFEEWAGEEEADATATAYARELRQFSQAWRSMINQKLPEAIARWRAELQAAGGQLPPAEPFPRDVANEFLARFEAISSRGTGAGGTPRDPHLPPPGDWDEAVKLLGLDGSGIMPPLGGEVAAAITLLPEGIELHPAEIDRIKFALNGIELFRVEGREEGSAYYFLPQVHTAALRMIRQVLTTAYLRQRAGTTLGLGRQLIFPWVMRGGMRGQQPFWLEVSPGGRPDQLVLDRIVVVGTSQLPPRFIEEFLKTGVTLTVPQEGGGTRSVHFDLVQPVQKTVAVDSYTLPAEADIGELAKMIIDASFHDRYPEGGYVPGKSRFQPIEEGYLTVPEIMEMKLEDAYLRRVPQEGEEGGEEPAPAPKAGEAGAVERRQRFFTVGRVRDWTTYIEQQLSMQRLQGVPDIKSPSYYFLRVRTSHKGPVRVLLHLRRITDNFGEHLRLKRIPGFALATEIAGRGQTDTYDVPWTHSRLTALYRDIEEKIPEAERGRYIRRFRSMAGGGRYDSFNPGQIALNLRELRRSRWGVYFRLRRDAGQLTRQEMIDQGLTPRTIEILRTFVQRHVPEDYRDIYFQQIRGNRSPYEVLINLRQLARSYADQMSGDMRNDILRVLPPEPSRAVRLTRLRQQIEADVARMRDLPEHIAEGLETKRILVETALFGATEHSLLSLAQLERLAREFREDVDQRTYAHELEVARSAERKKGPGGGEGSGTPPPPSGTPPPSSETPPPVEGSTASTFGGYFGGISVIDSGGTSAVLPSDDWVTTDTGSDGAFSLEGGGYFLDGAFPPVVVPPASAPSPMVH